MEEREEDVTTQSIWTREVRKQMRKRLRERERERVGEGVRMRARVERRGGDCCRDSEL